MYVCSLCRGLFHEPVTIRCGHTFCRKCLEKEWAKTSKDTTCDRCGTVHLGLKPASLGTNVVLSNLLRKWFPARSRAAELKAEANKYFEERDFQRAVTQYSEAIALYDADHLLFSNRSHAYASLQQYDRALEDADKVVSMMPDWPKGFYRKGNALYGLGRHALAAVSFLHCLALDPRIALAKENLMKTVKTMSEKQGEASREEPEETDGSSQSSKQEVSKFRALVCASNLDLCALKPHLSAETWSLLKQAMGNEEEEEEQRTVMETDRTESCDTGTVSGNSDSAHCREEEEEQHQHHLRGQSMEEEGGSSTEHQHASASGASPNSLEAEAEVKLDPSLMAVEDVECSLCYRLFHQPVTTPCGHTFCKQCLDRCLDHHTSCPMCKRSLAEYLAERRCAVTEVLQLILETCFAGEHRERKQTHEEEMQELARVGQDTQHEVPIFVCTLAFPSVVCPLHVFEPRYRLMIRQCVEAGTRQFGMCACLSDAEEDFSEYGCMLEVRDVHYLADGRSLVDTVGGRRFRVLSKGQRDGYNTARVEFLHDQPIPEHDLAEIQAEQADLHSKMQTFVTSLPLFHRARLTERFGNMPDLDPNPGTTANGPAWAWWCIAVLPLSPAEQLELVASTSYKHRLSRMRHMISQLRPRLL